jgi:hypothetical protein
MAFFIITSGDKGYRFLERLHWEGVKFSELILIS